MSDIKHSPEVQPTIDTKDIENFIDRRQWEMLPEKTYLQRFTVTHALRRQLPYGKWTCADGREVVFNREYQPILQRLNGVCAYANPGEWVENIIDTEMYYDDLTNPIGATKYAGHLPEARVRRMCKRSMLICLKVLKEFTPEERGSVSREWSIKQSY
jgi:hypothetical protein